MCFELCRRASQASLSRQTRLVERSATRRVRTKFIEVCRTLATYSELMANPPFLAAPLKSGMMRLLRGSGRTAIAAEFQENRRVLQNAKTAMIPFDRKQGKSIDCKIYAATFKCSPVSCTASTDLLAAEVRTVIIVVAEVQFSSTSPRLKSTYNAIRRVCQTCTSPGSVWTSLRCAFSSLYNDCRTVTGLQDAVATNFGR